MSMVHKSIKEAFFIVTNLILGQWFGSEVLLVASVAWSVFGQLSKCSISAGQEIAAVLTLNCTVRGRSRGWGCDLQTSRTLRQFCCLLRADNRIFTRLILRRHQYGATYKSFTEWLAYSFAFASMFSPIVLCDSIGWFQIQIYIMYFSHISAFFLWYYTFISISMA